VTDEVESGPHESSPSSEDRTASELVLKEIERVLDSQLDNFKSLTSRAGTVLSVLIGSLTATLTVAGAVAHPPLWALAVPAAPLMAALVTSCAVFAGSEVSVGPDPDSLVDRMADPALEVRAELIRFYRDQIAGAPATADDPGFEGNRKLLHRKERLFVASVVLLALTVASLVGVALTLYFV
jgi:hypothetical protein